MTYDVNRREEVPIILALYIFWSIVLRTCLYIPAPADNTAPDDTDDTDPQD